MFDKFVMFLLRILVFFFGFALMYLGFLVTGHQSSSAFEMGLLLMVGGVFASIASVRAK